jgi:NOL1/NOP2/fmu family ribosome biogenesis protein
LRFLKKEEISLPVAERGWYIVRYDGLGLGWVKSIGNRFNNYLPKNQRIRMEIE